jgi:RNA polymerase sigma-70 factor (ECF subfamily)
MNAITRYGAQSGERPERASACSLSEADDAVQEAWLRFSRVDTSDVENLRGWLKTIVAPVA